MQLLICWCCMRLVAYVMWTCSKLDWKMYLTETAHKDSVRPVRMDCRCRAQWRRNWKKAELALWVRPRDMNPLTWIRLYQTGIWAFYQDTCVHGNTICLRIKQRFEKLKRLYASGLKSLVGSESWPAELAWLQRLGSSPLHIILA